MKIYSATLNNTRTLTHWSTDAPHKFPSGTAVTAIELDDTHYHLNATLNGETYTGYCQASDLELGDITATVNEG